MQKKRRDYHSGESEKAHLGVGSKWVVVGGQGDSVGALEGVNSVGALDLNHIVTLQFFNLPVDV
jgi:hypothetical protein